MSIAHSTHLRLSLQQIRSVRLPSVRKTEGSPRTPLSCLRQNALGPRLMAIVTEQLTPTQLFKRQWESYQVVRAAILQLTTGSPWDGGCGCLIENR